MLDREPFLKAIFADPADDTPRLVFADFLEEHGDHAWAELIRLQCRPDAGHSPRVWELVRRVYPESGDSPPADFLIDRGFRKILEIRVTADVLADPGRFRMAAVTDNPEWYGATRLKVVGGQIVTPEPLATILTSPATANVTELDLSGQLAEIAGETVGVGDEQVVLYDTEQRPVISLRMVQALAEMRECRRLTELDLTHNDLDNDALRAVANSPHLFRLKRFAFTKGNRFRGRTWQLLLERLGPDVVE